MEDETQDTANPPSELELVTVFASDAITAEMEAMEIQAILEANGIPVVNVAASVIPSLPVELRVAKEHAEQALAWIAEAQAAGPAAAEQAELEGEQQA
ncbi:MAG: hypothetical protein HY822_08800 [Acidobacteria bacterium]|nr:hypothetical protein [Acidobacteriota bacterium]